VQFELSCDCTSSTAVGFGIGINRIKADVFSRNLILKPQLVVISYLFSIILADTVQFPVYFFVKILFLHAVDHRQQFGSQSELCILCSEEVAFNGTGNCDGISTEYGFFVSLDSLLIGLTELPVAPQIIDMIASDRHDTPTSKKYIMRMYPTYHHKYIRDDDGLINLIKLP